MHWLAVIKHNCDTWKRTKKSNYKASVFLPHKNARRQIFQGACTEPPASPVSLG